MPNHIKQLSLGALNDDESVPDHFDFGPSTANAEIYDLPGAYAQRFDSIEPVDDSADVEPVVDPFGGLWLCRGEGEDRECIPW